MNSSDDPKRIHRSLQPRSGDWSEAEAWREAEGGWQPVYGSFRGMGFSIEWHDFIAKRELDWAASFHIGSVELCLNLDGDGLVEGKNGRLDFTTDTAGFYRCDSMPRRAVRRAGQHHRFLTVEYAPVFLEKHLTPVAGLMDRAAAPRNGKQEPEFEIGQISRLTTTQQQFITALRHPPVYASAHPVWYECKAIEIALMFFVRPAPSQEMFCTRQKQIAQQRVEAVKSVLAENLTSPPSLEELGRRIGCSHFYLSRIFSAHTGRTIVQHLRQLRMEKAAELLRSGKFNVTEVALEVGYNSLSHFSSAFQETFGCCPGLYPLTTATQKSARREK